MLTKTLVQKPAAIKMHELQKEVNLLRSCLTSFLGEDPEGNYRPKFIKDVLASVEKKPTRVFLGAKNFLKEIEEL
ncbi:MAG: hypothetical protein V1664_05095 [Candidatus Uhrbacteria bacterium]